MTQWSDCHAACGASVRKREVTCTYRELDKIVDQSECDAAAKPNAIGVCEDHTLCQYNWQTTCEGQETWCHWDGCDAKCGAGFETRGVKCVRTGADAEPAYVDADDIPAWHNFNGCVSPKPLEKRECWSATGCNFNWAATPWSRCDAQCGAFGEQTRQVGCVRTQPSHATSTIGLLDPSLAVAEAMCSMGTKPDNVQPCTNSDGCEYRYQVGDWAACPDGCGHEQQTRLVECVRGPRQQRLDLVGTFPGDITGQTIPFVPQYDLAYGTIVFDLEFDQFTGKDVVLIDRRKGNGFVLYLSSNGHLGLQPTSNYGVSTGACKMPTDEAGLVAGTKYTVAVQWSTLVDERLAVYVDGALAFEGQNTVAWSWDHPDERLPWLIGADDEPQDDWGTFLGTLADVEIYDGAVEGRVEEELLDADVEHADQFFCERRNEQRVTSGFYRIRSVGSGRHLVSLDEELVTESAHLHNPTGNTSAVFELQEQADGTFEILNARTSKWLWADEYDSHTIKVVGVTSEEGADPMARFLLQAHSDGSHQITVRGSQRWLREEEAPTGNSHILTTSSPAHDDEAARFVFERLPDHRWWHLIMKIGGDDTFRYSSPYWTNDETLHADDPAQANRKLRAFNDVKFDTIRGCVGSPRSNCMTYQFPNVWASARDLFSSSSIKKGDLKQSDFDRVFTPEPSGCSMQMPGFNVEGNTGKWGGNKARWGYLANMPEQQCQSADSDDSDAALGFGLEGASPDSEAHHGRSSSLAGYGAGYTDFFMSGAASGEPLDAAGDLAVNTIGAGPGDSAGRAAEAWLFVSDSTMDEMGHCMTMEHMGVVNVDSEMLTFPLVDRFPVYDYGSPTAPRDEMDWQNQCGGLPETASAFGPLYGRRTWFKGQAKETTTFSYMLQFESPALVTSVSLVGSNWAGSTVQLLDETRAVIGERVLTTDDCGPCEVCEVNVPGSAVPGRVFYLQEVTSAHEVQRGRLRSSICVHAESSHVLQVSDCQASSVEEDDQLGKLRCDYAFDGDAITAWSSNEGPKSSDAAAVPDEKAVGSWVSGHFDGRRLVSEVRYQQFFSKANSNKEVEFQFMDGNDVATRIVVLKPNIDGLETYTFAPAWADRFKMVVRSVYGAVGNNGATEMQFVEHVGGYVHNPGFEVITPPHVEDAPLPEMAVLGEGAAGAPAGMGWTVGSGRVSYGSFASVKVGLAPEGRQVLMLSGAAKNDDGEDEIAMGAVYQYLQLTEGETYRLRFALSGSYDADAASDVTLKSVQVTWAGAVIATVDVDTLGFGPQHLPWTYHDFEVTATADVVKLSLEGMTAGVLIDDVSVFYGGRPADTRTCEARTAGECVCSWGGLKGWDDIACEVPGNSQCGAGTQTREPECKIRMEGHPFDGDDCPGMDGCNDEAISEEELTQKCSDRSGCDFIWTHGDWGPDTCPEAEDDDAMRAKLCPNACPRTCRESAVKTRPVECHRLDPDTDMGFTNVPLDRCGAPDSHGFLKPQDAMACTNDEACVTRWQCSSWSACESGCGTSKKTRSCNCWRSDGVNGADPSLCLEKGLEMPNEEMECKSFDKCKFMWHVADDEPAGAH